MVRTSELKLKINEVKRILNIVSIISAKLSIITLLAMIYMVWNDIDVEYIFIDIVVLSLLVLIFYRVYSCLKIQKLLEELAHSMDDIDNKSNRVSIAFKLITAIYTLYPKYKTYICKEYRNEEF